MGSLANVTVKLEELFALCNQSFYNSQLPRPVIMVAPDQTRGAYGWCSVAKIWREGTQSDPNEGQYEICFTAEHLNREPESVLGTMLHEMAHLFDIINKIQDTSNGGYYHNKNFKNTAERHGLIIEQGPMYGWHVTSLNEEGKKFLKKLDFDKFDLRRMMAVGRTGWTSGKTTGPQGATGEKAKRKKKPKFKYQCPVCGEKITVNKEIRITHSDCGAVMELVEEKDRE